MRPSELKIGKYCGVLHDVLDLQQLRTEELIEESLAPAAGPRWTSTALQRDVVDSGKSRKTRKTSRVFTGTGRYVGNQNGVLPVREGVRQGWRFDSDR